MSTFSNFLGKAKMLAARFFWGAQPTPVQTPSSKVDQAQELTETEKPEQKEKIYVGPYTQHLRKRRNNVLFPEDRRTIKTKEWEDAILYDAPRIKAHKDKSAAMIADILIGAAPCDADTLKGKTVNEIFLHFYEKLTQWDELIREYVFLQGTSPVVGEDLSGPQDWDPEQDVYFKDVLVKIRDDFEERIRQSTLQHFNDEGIRLFAQTREKMHKTSFEKSHFQQIPHDCIFMGDFDLYPRLFSESDSVLKDHIQFCMQSDASEELINQLKRSFILCLEKTKKILNQMPIGSDESSADQVGRNMRYIGGLLQKGQILGILNDDASYTIPYTELIKIIEA